MGGRHEYVFQAGFGDGITQCTVAQLRAQPGYRVLRGSAQQNSQLQSLLGGGLHLRQLQGPLLDLAQVGAADFDHAPVEFRHQGPGRPVFPEMASFEDGQLVAALGLVHIVSGHQDGGARVTEVEQFFPEIAAVFRVHRGGGFVQEQHGGRVQGSHRQRQALTLAAAHGAGEAIAHGGESVTIQQLLYARTGCAAAEAVYSRHEHHVLGDGQLVVQREFLGHVADFAPQRLRFGGNFQLQYRHLPRGRGEQPAEHADDGGLARAVGAQEAIDLSGRHVQVHTVHGDHLAKVPGQGPGPDRRFSHRPAAPGPAPRWEGPRRPRARIPPGIPGGRGPPR